MTFFLASIMDTSVSALLEADPATYNLPELKGRGALSLSSDYKSLLNLFSLKVSEEIEDKLTHVAGNTYSLKRGHSRGMESLQ